MTISTFLDPSQMPARTMDQQTFDPLMAAVMQRLPTWGAEVNATTANLNSIAAGGAYAIPYVYAGPAGEGGKLTFSGGTMDTSNFLTLDNVSAGGLTVAARVASFGASTSAVKGTLRIEKQGDPTKFLAFNVTGVTASTGYQSVYVTKVESSSSNPFNLNDALILQFTRAGDKGDNALTNQLIVRDQRGAGAAPQAFSAATWNACTLNTIIVNDIGATLSGSSIVVPAGKYLIEGSSAVQGDASGLAHQLRLFNVTSNAVADVGTSEYASNVGAYRSFIRSALTLAVATTLRFDHYLSRAENGGVGSGSGANEIYREFRFTKVA